MSDAPLVRHAGRADLPAVAELAARHAEYERAAPPPDDLSDRLAALLFDTAAPRLRCLVAELPDGSLVGYATCSPELSTWEGREYLHMDCLFLLPGHRGLGLGVLLMDAGPPRHARWDSARCSGRRRRGTTGRSASTTGWAPAPGKRCATPYPLLPERQTPNLRRVYRVPHVPPGTDPHRLP
jgi:GNAT superfamily N-acetyltransferase